MAHRAAAVFLLQPWAVGLSSAGKVKRIARRAAICIIRVMMFSLLRCSILRFLLGAEVVSLYIFG